MSRTISADPSPTAIVPHERSARGDLRVWAMLLVGLGFAWAGSTVDPATNCDASGDCAPWLVPLAYGMGIAFALGGAGALWANPRRGSRIDPVTGDLVWWQGRIGSGLHIKAGDEGRIHPARIGALLIMRDGDGEDGVHLFDLDGERQPHFDAEVIPWPTTDWANRLVRRYPHIRLEIQG